MSELTGGRTITIYGQNRVVEDLIAARRASGGELLYEVSDVSLHDLESERPTIRFRHEGREETLECDVVAGCDGFHGVSRASIPAGVLTEYERVYPFGWLGILAEVAPSTEELIYAYHERGFALHSLRSPAISRLYIQVAADEDVEAWSDDRIWSELHAAARTRRRLDAAGGAGDREGNRAAAELRRRADAARAPLPRGRRGAHRAADRREGAQPRRRGRDRARPRDRRASTRPAARRASTRYSDTCLRRVWQGERFSWQMTSMLHRFPDEGPFGARLQLAQLEQVVSSRAAATALAESYVGLPIL